MSIFVDPPRDPRKAECSGLYLYGSGYMARDDVRMAIVRGEDTRNMASSFCNDTCPIKARCEARHRERVASLLPDEVESFERDVARGKKRGFSRDFVALTRMRAGEPDPYYKVALENFRKGAADARRVAGSPVVRRG